jgi:hypothetical protein
MRGMDNDEPLSGIYIGRSGDIQDRLGVHHSFSAKKKGEPPLHRSRYSRVECLYMADMDTLPTAQRSDSWTAFLSSIAELAVMIGLATNRSSRQGEFRTLITQLYKDSLRQASSVPSHKAYMNRREYRLSNPGGARQDTRQLAIRRRRYHYRPTYQDEPLSKGRGPRSYCPHLTD